MPQEQVQRNAQSQQQDETQQQRSDDAQQRMQTQDLDAVLDDIESTLESNAEEYVSSFVQKGGQ
ncbi:ubiquitin-like protein Pup [Bifidobacterium psychraerophilum]|jgi:ubiquitin-like protein Pup|uniref:ubiquitin-like protein Pup n=1 Tax=Bifidobacterium psychraerophilum TaxID=218140 RepID=UPI0023F24235|nr:ubiquitin-like protein Pup [Bifidobacterium psychraerophilum]MCI1660529.1 ubiquitin-like protein Pup [Bifidobacterium psychraerophilum]MCI1805149.1 ubiquitin-like protein Pup [Bifidobacterium psychraerophilum]MCI2175663.1 ubiquitin-like protein Pup [Bifidobacterium psychraerophilum]MCI2181669.1 ubiquitin-like protein Pup [Bifidobacterium psychraerophilum]